MPKSTHKTPSQIRYEQSHPTMSFRLPKELYDQLKEHLATRGASFADFVRESLGAQQLKMPDMEEIKEKAWNEGYDQAEEDYEIFFYCSVCNKRVAVLSGSKCHQEIMRYLREAGWGHATCIKRLTQG